MLIADSIVNNITGKLYILLMIEYQLWFTVWCIHSEPIIRANTDFCEQPRHRMAMNNGFTILMYTVNK